MNGPKEKISPDLSGKRQWMNVSPAEGRVYCIKSSFKTFDPSWSPLLSIWRGACGQHFDKVNAVIQQSSNFVYNGGWLHILTDIV